MLPVDALGQDMRKPTAIGMDERGRTSRNGPRVLLSGFRWYTNSISSSISVCLILDFPFFSFPVLDIQSSPNKLPWKRMEGQSAASGTSSESS